jgi:cytochrome c peroxidase
MTMKSQLNASGLHRETVNRAFVGLAIVACAGGLAGLITLGGHRATADERDPNLLAFDNEAGQARTFNVKGAIDLDNPFFQDLGTNGRRCVSCHQPENAWTITPANVQSRFDATEGADPIFRNNDGSNCEGVHPESMEEKQAAYSLLLNRGLIRVGLNVPAGAEFVIDSVSDPNQCAPATNDASLYRRPLPSSNVSFLSAIMWDGRESSSTTTIEQDLLHQANAATRGHAEGALDLTADQAQQIVAFELGLFTAQARDRHAGNLQSQGATGGPAPLARQPFFIGINDPVGLNPTGAAFDPKAFTLFNGWERLKSSDTDPYIESRRAIVRGQAIFNTRPITLAGVPGLNGQTFSNGVTLPETFGGTCTTCHDSPNAGNHSVKAPLNIGLTDPSVAPYLPVYTLRNLTTQDTVETTDPGRAMITGKWKDIGKFKGPVLRGLAARAPYFHNGSAATLEEAIEFYEKRFDLGLTVQEKSDLVAFLRAL